MNYFSLRTRGLFQYGDLHALFAQFFGGTVLRGYQEWSQRLQVSVGSLIGRITELLMLYSALWRVVYASAEGAAVSRKWASVRPQFNNNPDHRQRQEVDPPLSAVKVQPDPEVIPSENWTYSHLISKRKSRPRIVSSGFGKAHFRNAWKRLLRVSHDSLPCLREMFAAFAAHKNGQHVRRGNAVAHGLGGAALKAAHLSTAPVFVVVEVATVKVLRYITSKLTRRNPATTLKGQNGAHRATCFRTASMWRSSCASFMKAEMVRTS